MREWEALREGGDTSPDPRKSILDAITELINEWSQIGYHPLVMIDANAELYEKQMCEFITRHGLIDLVNDSNDGTPPSSYNRGSRHIDFPLGDDYVRNAIIKSGALGSHDGVSLSDHTLQFIDFDCNKLFNTTSAVPMARYEREFHLKDIRRKDKFIEKLTEIYKHQNLPMRVELLAKDLQLLGPTPELIQHYQVLDWKEEFWVCKVGCTRHRWPHTPPTQIHLFLR
jgi:hypothetical protein